MTEQLQEPKEEKQEENPGQGQGQDRILVPRAAQQRPYRRKFAQDRPAWFVWDGVLDDQGVKQLDGYEQGFYIVCGNCGVPIRIPNGIGREGVVTPSVAHKCNQEFAEGDWHVEVTLEGWADMAKNRTANVTLDLIGPKPSMEA